MKSANTTFRIGEQTYCGEIDYKLVIDGDQPFLTLDKELKLLVLAPKLVHISGEYSASLQFFFIDFPLLKMNVPIFSSIAECVIESIYFSTSSKIKSYAFGDESFTE